MGKALGLFASMATAIAAGFGLAGVVIAGQSGYEGVQAYIAMTLMCLLLAFISIGLGLMAAVVAGTRAKAIGAALGLWFFLVLFYDLLVLGAAILLKERTANFVFFASVFGNPVEIVRVSALLAIGGENIFGAAGPMLLKFLGGRTAAGLVLAAAASLWVILPLAIAARLFRKREI